jgi:hypothetical protein
MNRALGLPPSLLNPFMLCKFNFCFHSTNRNYKACQLCGSETNPWVYGLGNVNLSLHGFTALVNHDRFFSFLILYTVGRTPWIGDQPVSRLLPTHRINANIHPCFEWDSNPRTQCSSWRRRFMSYTTRSLRSTKCKLRHSIIILAVRPFPF